MANGGISVSSADPDDTGRRARHRPSALSERWIALRNALLSNQRFQRLALRFPLTRPIARRRARDAFDLCAGFVYAQILQAMVRLDVFTTLRDGPQPLSAIAAHHRLACGPLEQLAGAAAALGLLERLSGDRIALGPLGAALLANPGALAMVAHHDRLYSDLEDPVAFLRERHEPGRLGAFWPYAAGDDPAAIGESEAAGYSALMAASHAIVTDEIFAAYPVARHRALLDVGGGEAGFAIAAARVAPHLACSVFDLPAVAARARRRIATAGLSERIQAIGGDAFRDPLPAGADLVTLIRILHDHDDEAACALLTTVRRAIAPDGRLLVAEPMSQWRRGDRIADAYFGIYLLAMGSGRPRSASELSDLLRAAGFVPRRLSGRGAWMSGLLLARPA